MTADLVGEATFGRTSSEATERGDLRVVGTVGRRPILHVMPVIFLLI
jgi:hypothetical protein